jgi:Bacterial low temperature requirement A protein (LtrA)
MLPGLFMNAAIVRAFDEQPLAFVAPLLAIRIGRTLLSTIPGAPTPMLRRHYIIMLAWILASAPLWLAGAYAAHGPQPGACRTLGWARVGPGRFALPSVVAGSLCGPATRPAQPSAPRPTGCSGSPASLDALPRSAGAKIQVARIRAEALHPSDV